MTTKEILSIKEQFDSPFLEEVACLDLDLDLQDKTVGNSPTKTKPHLRDGAIQCRIFYLNGRKKEKGAVNPSVEPLT